MVAAGTDTAALSLRGIVKTFPGVRALGGVDFDLKGGEVHVLLGQNGAGKSTLVKILSGVHAPDAGVIEIAGQALRNLTPQTAAQHGIAMVHQELCLVPALSVAENILLGAMPRGRLGAVDWAVAERRAADLLARLGVTINPRAAVGELEVAEQQLVEIAKALSRDPKVVLLDEPTSALSDTERARLFVVIRALKATGVGLIYISHHLSEVPLIGDRVSVLRDGMLVQTRAAAGATEADLAELMTGRAVGDQYPRGAPADRGRAALDVQGLVYGAKLAGIDFTLHYGEILGIFGLMGAGQAELARVLFGLDQPGGGTLAVDGEAARFASPADAIARGLALISRDRRQSLVPMLPTGPNLSLAWLANRAPWGLLDLARERAETERYISSLKIEPPLPQREVRFFSGGNQQKVVLARWMSSRSRILIFDEPARGIDVGSKAEVFALMAGLAREGAAILMISSEPAELAGMADRTLVLSKGAVRIELSAAETTQQRLLQEAG